MSESQPLKDRRTADPYFDRRSGEDRRELYDLDYFEQGGIERRSGIKPRQKGERRAQRTGNRNSAIYGINLISRTT